MIISNKYKIIVIVAETVSHKWELEAEVVRAYNRNTSLDSGKTIIISINTITDTHLCLCFFKILQKSIILVDV